MVRCHMGTGDERPSMPGMFIQAILSVSTN